MILEIVGLSDKRTKKIKEVLDEGFKRLDAIKVDFLHYSDLGYNGNLFWKLNDEDESSKRKRKVYFQPELPRNDNE